MALIKCPNCGNPVSDKAVKCPHCDFVLHSFHPQNTKKEGKGYIGFIIPGIILTSFYGPIFLGLTIDNLINSDYEGILISSFLAIPMVIGIIFLVIGFKKRRKYRNSLD